MVQSSIGREDNILIFRRLALIVTGLAGLPLVIGWVISNVMMHPRRRIEDNTLDDFGLVAEDVTFSSRDGTGLSGWFIPAQRSPAPGIVLSHGWARSRAELLPHANFLHRAGYAVVLFDYRHRGESEGAAITMGLREQGDLLGAIDYLASRSEVDASRIGLLGMSMGGAIGMLVAAGDQRVRALVVECPYSSPDVFTSRSLQHYGHLPKFPFGDIARWVVERRIGGSLNDADPSRVVAAISPRPIFVIAAERDVIIGHEETARLFQAASEPKRYWFIPGAGHARCWQLTRDEYEERVLEFFDEHIMAAGVPREARHSA